ncbi:MAG: hypothetical protein HYV07_28270 [Deltaproteobacteria bacterium]|nr:hypothetical protein [Deltaproteobacteria bacterium]
MPADLNQNQRDTLESTKRVATPAEFNVLLEAAMPNINAVVPEILAPSQPVRDTLTELRDLFLAVDDNRSRLAARGYGEARVNAFRDAIILLDTSHSWFGETPAAEKRPRAIEELVAASRPWRARLAAVGEAAFWAEPAISELFADVNSTGSLQEEIADLTMLNGLVAKHRARLEPYGLTQELVNQGRNLADEASGRDLGAILGFRDAQEARDLRNKLLTYAVTLSREARMAGVNACWEDENRRKRFEASTFRLALRRLRPKRRAAEVAEAPVPSPTPSPVPE